MIDLNELQIEHNQWQNENFDSWTTEQIVLGVVEEVGELARAIIKPSWGDRRGREYWDRKAMDAVGDTFIFLMGVCTAKGWNIETVINDTWAEVKDRSYGTG